jgi:hypothetical protein
MITGDWVSLGRMFPKQMRYQTALRPAETASSGFSRDFNVRAQPRPGREPS